MRLAIFGAGGFGREIEPFVHQAVGHDGRELVFVSDFHEPLTNGVRVLKLEELQPGDQIVIAVADMAARRELAARCEAQGLDFATVMAPQFIRYRDVEIGEGGIFCAGSIVTSNVRIGRHFHCNLNSYIAHDCRIGDFVTFAPNVCCNGSVTIEDDVYIGTGAILKPGVRIGRGAMVGMGAVVLKDVPPGQTVVGNPAAPIRRQAAASA
jgi:sugar O-acyltransferase (sialic acid O-acetyltransferase NeuD family)